MRAGHAAEHRTSSISRRMTERSRSSDDGLRCEFCRMSDRMSTAFGTSDFRTCHRALAKRHLIATCQLAGQDPHIRAQAITCGLNGCLLHWRGSRAATG